MTKTNKNTLLIILISAVLVSILINFKTIVFVLDHLETHALADLTTRPMARIYFGLITFTAHILIFSVTALFNYSWKNKLLPSNWSKSVRILLTILISVAILYIFSYSESKWIEHVFTGLGKHVSPDYFFFANYIVAILASAEAYFIILLRKIKTAELENIRLKEERSNAELAALKEQISPHFFFNTLNSLSAVIRTEKKSDSLNFVENMSEVYRYILDSEANDTVPVSDELAFVDAYAHLLNKRFGTNLQIEQHVDEAFKKHHIPPMALQILIENVVKHNKLSAQNPVVITIENEHDSLIINNNKQLKQRTNGHGLGLANLNKRCKMITGIEIDILNNDEIFQVKIPVIKLESE
ncbi:histidine kinase [bacterium]|nr:histidine kinase [bacterium]